MRGIEAEAVKWSWAKAKMHVKSESNNFFQDSTQGLSQEAEMLLVVGSFLNRIHFIAEETLTEEKL